MNTNPDSWDLINFFVIDWATKDKFLSVFFLHWDLISKAAVAKNLWGPSEIVNSSRARCLDVIVSKQICHFSLVCYASRLCKSFWANFLQYLTVWFCGQRGWESSEPKLSAPSPWQWTKSLLGHWVHISQHIRLDLVLSLSLLWWYEGTFYHQACGTNVSTISLLKVQRRISKQYIYIFFFPLSWYAKWSACPWRAVIQEQCLVPGAPGKWQGAAICTMNFQRKVPVGKEASA